MVLLCGDPRIPADSTCIEGKVVEGGGGGLAPVSGTC